MCTNCRSIWNPYSRKSVLVKCGKCDACQQEKAMKRANRIRNNVTPGTIALFVTLTYSNDYVPFVKLDEFNSSLTELNVYRNCSCRWTYDRHSDDYTFVRDFGERVVSKVDASSLVDKSGKYMHLVGLPKDHIGVNLFSDIQKFYKRLRQILIRHYNYDKSFSYFACTEYGGHTYRPHSHHLIFIPATYETTFRDAIVKAWPYADRRRTAKFIECAKDAASYVASYVNSNSNLLPLLSCDFFKQKHSQSKGFGVVLDCFQLPVLLQKIDTGDLYYYLNQKFDGTSSVIKLPIPKYVLYRYFPICKGFSWLSSCQLCSVLLNPQKVGDVLTDFDSYQIYKSNIQEYDYTRHSWCDSLRLVSFVPLYRRTKLDNPVYHYTPKETYQIYVRLENCYQRFHRETGLGRYDYMHYYLRVWPLYFSILERLCHEQPNIDYSQFYENANELVNNILAAPTLSYIQDFVIDPNKRIDVIESTNKYRSLYSRMNKQRKVTNYIMAEIGYNV